MRLTTLPEDYNPPRGLKRFYLQLSHGDGRKHTCSVDHLDDEVLAWLLRVLLAEDGARKLKADSYRDAGELGKAARAN